MPEKASRQTVAFWVAAETGFDRVAEETGLAGADYTVVIEPKTGFALERRLA